MPPAIVQSFTVAFAFRLLNAPLEITRPVVAGTPFAVSAAFPSCRLRVFCDTPVPNVSLAVPVTV